MVPAHEVSEPRAAAPASASGFLPFGIAPGNAPVRAFESTPAPTPTPHDPTGLELGMGALMRFKSLMALEGHDVQLARMCYDRLYAYERFALAHAGGTDALKRLSLELFQIYHRRSAAGRVPQ